MLLHKTLMLVLMALIPKLGSAKALSLRTVVSRTDTFDDLSITPVAQATIHDKFGTLYYDPEIVYTPIGGTTSEVITAGIKAYFKPTLAVLRGNPTLSPPPDSNKGVRLKELYFSSMQIGFRAKANLPISCILTIQALKPKVAGQPDAPVLDAAEQPIHEVSFYTPKLEAASVNPLRITANMTQAVVRLLDVASYKVTGRSSNTEALAATFNLVYVPNLPFALLFEVVTRLTQLFGAVGESAVDILADSISYKTGVDCLRKKPYEGEGGSEMCSTDSRID